MITCNGAIIFFGYAKCIIDWANDGILDWLLFAVIIFKKILSYIQAHRPEFSKLESSISSLETIIYNSNWLDLLEYKLFKFFLLRQTTIIFFSYLKLLSKNKVINPSFLKIWISQLKWSINFDLRDLEEMLRRSPNVDRVWPSQVQRPNGHYSDMKFYI
jgi:hypothetical protein